MDKSLVELQVVNKHGIIVPFALGPNVTCVITNAIIAGM